MAEKRCDLEFDYGQPLTSYELNAMVDAINDMPSRGSMFFNGSTQENYLVTGYNEEMMVGDMVIDSGETISTRRGNVYRIIRVDEQQRQVRRRALRASSSDVRWERLGVEDLSQISPDDDVVICAYRESDPDAVTFSYYSLSNYASAGGPEAALIPVVNDSYIEDVNVQNDLIVHIERDTTTYTDPTYIITAGSDGEATRKLYCLSSSTNDGVRFMSNTANGYQDEQWGISQEGYLITNVNPTQRYLGVYKNSSASTSYNWRAYTSINTYIKNQQFYFFVRRGTPPPPPPFTPYVFVDTQFVTNILGPA